jgi:hypothetical protein
MSTIEETIWTACSRAATASGQGSRVIGTTAFLGDLHRTFALIDAAMLSLVGERMIASVDGMKARLAEIDELLARAQSLIACINAMLDSKTHTNYEAHGYGH